MNEKFSLHKVIFEGVESYSKRDLHAELQIPKLAWWHRFWRKPLISLDEVEDDVLRIKQFYQDRGYYRTQVTGQIEPFNGLMNDKNNRLDLARIKNPDSDHDDMVDSPRKVKIIFTIREGPPVIIKTIVIHLMSDNQHDELRQLIMEAIMIKTGDILEISRYRDAKKSVLATLGNAGYPHADFTSRVTVNTDFNIAEITFDITPGPRCEFGPVFIDSAQKIVRKSVVENALTITSGARYDRNALLQSQQNLYDLDMFKNVVVRPYETTSELTRIPIRVEVEEKDRNAFNVGVGYGNEDGLRLKSAWTYRNLYGYGGKTTLTGQYSDLLQGIIADFEQPFFLDPKNTLNLKSGLEREILASHIGRNVFANLELRRKLRSHFTSTMGYQLEDNEIEELKTTEIEDVIQFNQDNNFLISSIKVGVTYDSTNSEINPTAGSLASISVEEASQALGSEIDYVNPTLELRHLKPVGKWGVVAGRIRFSSIVDTEDTTDIPIVKRLFLGGGNTVRGFGFQKLGPLDRNNNPIGGRTSFYGNLEHRFPIHGQFSGVVFFDAGMIDRQAFSIDDDGFRYSLGMGLRYHTIIGPIRVDFGYKLNPPTRSDVSSAIADHREVENRWRIHLSIGQAF